MNNEIKEILNIERYRNKDGYVENISLMPDEIDKLLDYITNLQQENERLKERVAYLERSNNRREDTIIGLRFEVAEQEDYKSRCEKASEYFKYQLENLDFYEDTKARMLCAMGITLLQNGSDDNE